MHAFSGCDSTVAFVGHGKQTAFKLIMSNDPGMWNTLHFVETDFNITPEKHLLWKSSCVYCMGDHCIAQWMSWGTLFCTTSAQRSPTTRMLWTSTSFEPTFRQLYGIQAAIWHSPLEPCMNIPSPPGHGWIVDDNDSISIDWISQESTPKGLLHMVHCSCTRSCVGSQCSCRHRALFVLNFAAALLW